MISSRSTLAPVLVVAALLLTAGCAGWTGKDVMRDQDIQVTKFDSNGLTLWSKTIDSGNVDYGTDILETSDGGFLVSGGYTKPYCNNGYTGPQTPQITPATPQCNPQENNPNSIIGGEPFFFQSHIPNPDASKIRVWIFGPKTAMMFGPHPAPLDKNNLTISGEATHDLVNGTYHVLFQYPDSSGMFDVGMSNPKYPTWILNTKGDLVLDIDNVRKGGMTGTDAADILEKAMNPTGSDLRTERTTLNVTTAWIGIDPIMNHTIGDKFTITGTTNLAEGEEVAFDMSPVIDHRSEFAKEWAMTHYVPNTFRIKAGDCGVNIWSWSIDSRSAPSGEYYIGVNAIRQDAYARTRFFMLSPTDSVAGPAIKITVNAS